MDSGATTTSILTFGLGGQAFGVPLVRVREIVGCRAVVRVPGAGRSLRGVMNLRGNVVPVIDLARHLGIGDTELSDNTCAVLIETEIDGVGSQIGGLVHEIHSVIELSAGELADVPEFGTPVDRRLIRALTPHSRGFAYVLDLDAIVATLM